MRSAGLHRRDGKPHDGHRHCAPKVHHSTAGDNAPGSGGQEKISPEAAQSFAEHMLVPPLQGGLSLLACVRRALPHAMLWLPLRGDSTPVTGRAGMPDSRGWACLAALLLLSACSPREDPEPVPPEAAAATEAEHYDCYAIGRLQGTMVQQSSLGEVHALFNQPIRSRWVFAWSAQWTAEVAHVDDRPHLSSRTFDHARSVELMFPADLEVPEGPIDPALSPAVVSLASRLVGLQPEGFDAKPSSVLLQSESFNLGEVFALAGIDPASVERREISVDATGKVLTEFEGETVSSADGGVGSAWLFGETLYGATDDPMHVVGDAYADVLPGVLVREFMGDTKASFEIEVREATVGRDGNVAGAKQAHLLLPPAGVLWDLESVVLLLAPDRTHVRQLSFSADLPGEFLQGNPRFADVTWEADLRLDVLYVAEQQD